MVANEEKDAVAITHIRDVAAQTVDRAAGTDYSLLTPSLIFAIGAGILTSVAMKRSKSGLAKRLERLAKS